MENKHLFEGKYVIGTITTKVFVSKDMLLKKESLLNCRLKVDEDGKN